MITTYILWKNFASTDKILAMHFYLQWNLNKLKFKGNYIFFLLTKVSLG